MISNVNEPGALHVGLGAHLLSLGRDYRGAGATWYIYNILRHLPAAAHDLRVRYTAFLHEPGFSPPDGHARQSLAVVDLVSRSAYRLGAGGCSRRLAPGANRRLACNGFCRSVVLPMSNGDHCARSLFFALPGGVQVIQPVLSGMDDADVCATSEPRDRHIREHTAGRDRPAGHVSGSSPSGLLWRRSHFLPGDKARAGCLSPTEGLAGAVYSESGHHRAAQERGAFDRSIWVSGRLGPR